MALTTIKMLRTEFDLLKQSQIGPTGIPVNSEQNVMAKICERLEAMEKDQKEMKTTFGAQIASAIRKGQMSNNAQPTQSDPMQHQGVTGQSSQKRQNPEKKEAAQNQRGWKTTDASSFKRESQPSREFKPENTMVIFNFAEYTK